MRVFRTGEIGISVVTVAELQYDVSKSENKQRDQAALEAFLDIADFSVDVTVTYGHIRAEYRSPILMPQPKVDIASVACSCRPGKRRNNTNYKPRSSVDLQ